MKRVQNLSNRAIVSRHGAPYRAALSICGVLLLALVFFSTATAQDGSSRGVRIGGYGGVQYTMYSGSVTQNPLIPGNCCQEFTSGNGIGVHYGLGLHVPLADKLALELRAGFVVVDGQMTETEFIGNALQNNTVVAAEVEHRLDLVFDMLTFDPSLVWQPFAFPFSLQAGPAVGYIVTADYALEEALVSPDNVTFTGGGRVRNESGGALDGVSELQFGLFASAGYDIAIGTRWTLRPEAGYWHYFTEVLSDVDLNIAGLRGGISLWYTFPTVASPPPPAKVPPPRPPVEKAKTPLLTASIAASGINERGTEEAVVRTQVEEYISTSMRPLLPYVFFAPSSARLPDRYARLTVHDTGRFSIERLYGVETLPTYRHILNILGRRMQDLPKANITLTGCNADTDDEAGNTALSRDRAEAVRTYLVSVWGVDPARIRTVSRNLPERASGQATTDGGEENRRVEITSNTQSLLAPVITRDTLRKVTPPVIRFRTQVKSESSVSTWRITAAQHARTLREFAGSGAVPEMVDWEINREQDNVPREEHQLEYSLAVRDATGQSVTAIGAAIPVEQITLRKKRRERIADKEIDRYSLILFDINSSELKAGQKAILRNLRNNITLASTVFITGYTDRLGDGTSNLTLSEQRAQAVASEIKAENMVVRGLGEDVLLHDNRTPEGRFYCRTVTLVVETPVRY